LNTPLAKSLLGKFKAKDRILFTVLNWGLGHASRSIPIIRHLIQMDCAIALASDGNALSLLRKEFPALNSYELPSYDVHYAHRSMALNMFRQSPRLFMSIRKEKRIVSEIVQDFKANIIISDNRYGTINKSCTNYFICHQIGIQSNSKILNALLRKAHTSRINKFDECWIPDFEDNSLAGEISQSKGLKQFRYIGPLSRLKRATTSIVYDIAVILSGPEPQRSILEEILISLFQSSKSSIAFVRGIDDEYTGLRSDNIKFFGLLDSQSVNDIINESKLVICRAGYSSIMDLITLQKKAIIIPTPGQTEQVYLSNHLKDHPLFESILQSELENKLLETISPILDY